MNNTKNKDKKRIRYVYTLELHSQLRRLVQATKLNIPMTKEGFGRKALGERVSDHVTRRTVNENNFTSSHSVAKSMNAKVNVLGTFSVNRIF